MSKKTFMMEYTLDKAQAELLKCIDDLNRYDESGEFDNNVLQEGPYLHQDSEDKTEKESAQFELDEPGFFNFIRNIKTRIRNCLE